MKKRFLYFAKILVGAIILFFIGVGFCQPAAFADNGGSGFTVSPMTQQVILDPGESYTASFKISNPSTNTNDIKYELSVTPFYVDENYATIFENIDNTGQLASWITIDSPTAGVLAPNDHIEIKFTINVPHGAPGGGQYASIIVSSKPVSSGVAGDSDTTVINESFQIGHLVFAEITGNTIRKGEVTEIDVPSYLSSGDITGTAIIRNVGNVHGTAKYTLQVFPLFSSEEIYTNEEDPEKATILPDRTLYMTTSMPNTPFFGLFNVVYTVEFEGVTTQVSKLVIKCPLWLIFVIALVIVALIVWIVIRIKMRKKSQDE